MYGLISERKVTIVLWLQVNYCLCYYTSFSTILPFAGGYFAICKCFTSICEHWAILQLLLHEKPTNEWFILQQKVWVGTLQVVNENASGKGSSLNWSSPLSLVIFTYAEVPLHMCLLLYLCLFHSCKSDCDSESKMCEPLRIIQLNPNHYHAKPNCLV